MMATRVMVPKGRTLLGWALVAPPVLLMLVFLIVPAVRVIATTFHTKGSPGLWTLANYQSFLTDGYALANLSVTLRTTFVTMALLLLVNFPIALYLRFRTGRLAVFIQALALFPMFVPGVIICYALMRYLGPNGLLQSVLELMGMHFYRTPIGGFWGPVIGLVWDGMPFTLLVLTAGLSAISNASIEAARDVGAGKWQILRAIILPQVKTTLTVITSLNFLSLFGSVLQPFMLGPASPEMMGPFMLRTFSSVRDPLMAGTQATITFLICSLAGLAYILTIRNRPDGGKT